jgi:hypothetical protein
VAIFLANYNSHQNKISNNDFYFFRKSGLSAACLTSRHANEEMPHIEEDLQRCARQSEVEFLQIVLEKFAKKHPATQWTNETK